ncbi:hypothetical protein D9M72_532060 [compost metagenome]
MAHRRDSTAGLEDRTGHPVDRAALRQVPHGAVAAGEKDRSVARGVDLIELGGRADRGAKRLVVPVALVDLIFEIETVDRRFTPFDRREFDGDPGRVEHGQRVRDLTEIEAGRLAAVSLSAVAGENEKHWFSGYRGCLRHHHFLFGNGPDVAGVADGVYLLSPIQAINSPSGK